MVITYKFIGEGVNGIDEEIHFGTDRTKLADRLEQAGMYIFGTKKFWAITVYKNGKYLGHIIRKQASPSYRIILWIDAKGFDMPLNWYIKELN